MKPLVHVRTLESRLGMHIDMSVGFYHNTSSLGYVPKRMFYVLIPICFFIGAGCALCVSQKPSDPMQSTDALVQDQQTVFQLDSQVYGNPPVMGNGSTFIPTPLVVV
ncbi:hypothetical protein Ocin01_10958 [Orchesella cincta]|uniref:Transmembrane protein n=1 Tax=Orchesella cincta TaxID=48709 RepID=A0A1D2MRJ5_ORCCI|nr:hypothetical protein Ocin01_10958 [Orchesella cincta]